MRAMEKEQMVPSYEDPTGDNADDSDGEGVLGPNKDIKKPGLHDVLLGRGGGTNNHTGNVTFRQLVNKHKMRYLACSKVDKPKVARDVVELWRKLEPPGRFLQRKDETKKGPGSVKDENIVWVEVGEKKAREKASQCLRERTADVIPYLSQLRQHQDQLTEQGVTMVHQKMQVSSQSAMDINHDIQATSPVARRGSLMNMPDRPNYINPILRRGSMPVAPTTPMSVPVTPTNMHMHSRRTSLPAVSHLQGQHQQHHPAEMQHMMAHQQQVLRDAYNVVERSGGMNPQQVQMMNEQLLAEREAMMRQQYANFEGNMMHSNMMHSNMMYEQNQMIRNQMMQQRHHMLRNSNMRAPPEMLSPTQTHHHRILNETYRSPVAVHNVNQRMAQQQQAAKIRPRSTPPKQQQQQSDSLPVKNITVTIGEDLEPLPYENVDDEPIPLSMVPDAPKSAPPAFVSPNVAHRSNRGGKKPSQDSPRQNHGQQRQAANQNKEGVQKDENSPGTLIEQNVTTEVDTGVEYNDLQPLPLDQAEEEKHEKGGQQQDDQSMSDNQGRKGKRKESAEGAQEDEAEITLREYRKTLEDYITNHQISTPAVDIDDDASEEGLGFDGIDASAWIQQALNDSSDLSLTNRKSGGRRGGLKEHRENSKKSLMSTGDGTSYMSLALSDMDQSEHSYEDLNESRRERGMSAARSMASNQSVMSELTDFSDLDL